MANQLFRTKPLSMLLDEMKGENRLRRILGPVQLTALGVGAIIGTGIFILTGVAAHDRTGPALMLSFVLAGLACFFAALCYAEFASVVPVARSAYTYAYATLGELFAWIIGWDLILEYAVGAATVANGWSGYFQSVMRMWAMTLPMALTGAPHKYDQGHILPNVIAQYEGQGVTQKALDEKEALWPAGSVMPAKGVYWIKAKRSGASVDALRENGKIAIVGEVGDSAVEGRIQNVEQAIINLPAILVALLVTAILVKGISESAGFNSVMVGIKVAAVLFVILVGAFYINPDNWTRDFAANGWRGVSFFGIPVLGKTKAAGEPVGVLAGAAIIFFA